MRPTMLVAILALTACPKPTPTPTPPPDVPCTCTIPGSEDPGWKATSIEGPPYGEIFIVAARKIVGDRCGKPEAETLKLLADQLVEQHVCATGPWADAVLVARPDSIFEEWHVVSYDDGCWTALERAYKGAWKNASAVANCK